MSPDAIVFWNKGRLKSGASARVVQIGRDWSLDGKVDALCEAFRIDVSKTLDVLGDVDTYLMEGPSADVLNEALNSRKRSYRSYFEEKLRNLGFTNSHASNLVYAVVLALETSDIGELQEEPDKRMYLLKKLDVQPRPPKVS